MVRMYVPARAFEEELFRPRAPEDAVDRHARRYVDQRDDTGPGDEVVEIVYALIRLLRASSLPAPG